MKKNRKGFTLAELLIVVAIIAVLVAISIPIFSSQLEKSRKAVDLANVRSAKAAAAAEYMNSGMTESKTYYYDAATGTVTDLETARSSIEGYGKSHHPFDSKKDGASGTPNTGKASGIVAVTINTGGTQSAVWELKGLVDVTQDNVNDYLVENSDGTNSLQFEQGTLSYVNITDGSILKSVKNKEKVTSIVFGKNNLFQDEQNDHKDTNKGVIFGTGNGSAFNGYTNLKKIDFSGIRIGGLDMTNLQQKGLSNLNEIVLPNQDGLFFDIEGKWYYKNSEGKEINLGKGAVNQNKNSRVDTRVNSDLKGATIYKRT
ncbi:MAG: prepilin-type N-terminal cleavage/methylation domain-containing protein, partial [Bilifractor sp.]|nr:prepilin-type N-terminal cleavage/methylation domain-containing protein [Lachnospiraceae bacterium]MDY2837156.1 prepilin-type N-terminal cleavage/methylation domain-containing protein [Bilifractor sp.]